MSYPVLAIANKLLASATDYDGGELMSNMKLQKMLYYQQGYHLAAFGTPLFDEDIEAWMYGPVVPLQEVRRGRYRTRNGSTSHAIGRGRIALSRCVYRLY